MLSQRKKRLISSLLGLFFAGLLLSTLPVTAREMKSPISLAPSSSGYQEYLRGHYPAAIRLWKEALSRIPQDSPKRSALLENLATAYQRTGQPHQALEAWQQITQYQQQNGLETVRSLTEQAQLYRQIGQPQKAITLICDSTSTPCSPGQAIERFKPQQPSIFIAAIGTLGEAYRQMGDYDQAIATLKTSLDEIPPGNAKILNSLANTYFNRADQWSQRASSARARNAIPQSRKFQLQADQDYQTSLNYYQESLDYSTNNPELQSQILLNLLRLRTQSPQHTSTAQAEQWMASIQSILPSLPEDTTKQMTRIALASMTTSERTPSGDQCSLSLLVDDQKAVLLLKQAAQSAQDIGDLRSQAYALGELGHYYECRADLTLALDLTQQALWLAEQNLQAIDNLYLWEWQMGRIYHAQGQVKQSLAAYERAYALLKQIRSDLLKSDRDLQYNFRDTIEPFYRQLASLQLEQITSSSTKPAASIFNSSIQIVDALKLAELQNYLGRDCVLFDQESNPNNNFLRSLDEQSIERQLQQLPEQSALVLPLIFDQRTAILLNYKQSDKIIQQLYWLNVPKSELDQNLIQFHKALRISYDLTQKYRQYSQLLYQWMILPMEPQLNEADIKTLVFIQDGLFRNIPMGALFDGERFLIQKYAIAMLPRISFSLANNSTEKNLKILGVGADQISVINDEEFSALPNVRPELEFLSSLFPNTEILLNNQFTRSNLQSELSRNAFNVLHIATHGRFGTIPEDSFLVTGQNQKLTITELENDLRQYRQQQAALDLLVLTACETATGDDRTTLGLAGVSVQAGARSTVASLWAIQDKATQKLMASFYEYLTTQNSKAEALQTAQIDLINEGEHPAIWSPYILVGDWT